MRDYTDDQLQMKWSRGLMEKGTVKWFDNKKGYGFILWTSADVDVFVHHTEINADGFKTLNQGEKVTFETEAGEKGIRAVKVRRELQ